jgi:uncharacterized membrane protein
MKKIWKWIIGIVLGLVVLSVLLIIGFMAFGHFHGDRFENGYSRGWSQQGPGMMPYGGFGDHLRGPGMMGYGGMLPFGGLIGGFFCLVFIALFVLGIFWLVRTFGKTHAVNSAAAQTTPAVTPAPLMDTCKKCGQPIQVDWKHCPNCGKKV